MFYVDSQRTVTRRDSSLIRSSRRPSHDDRFGDYFADHNITTARGMSTAGLNSESAVSLATRPRGSVRKEITTLLFESMLDTIIDSWEVITQPKLDEYSAAQNTDRTPSEITFTSKKKKPVVSKISKTKSAKSRSKLDLVDSTQSDPMQIIWWSAPDEKAIIRFKNGNIYEGSISLKAMNGEGRFQWADGTVYLGDFKDNEIRGKGVIQWKDDTWYDGDFVGNLRHGKGLYVNSRKQRSYTGGWHCGTKHGKGLIFYSNTFKNSYDGDWVHNVRHGYGIREYCKLSGYEGEWDRYVREGRGLMIWPNHDFYKGEWKNGTMSGSGIYIWDTNFNNSMSSPSINAYRGQWVKGKRHGYGILNLGLGLGSHYKGGFKDNKKHGAGKFVTNNGLILESKKLFVDDDMGSLYIDENCDKEVANKCQRNEPYEFDICDNTVGLRFHVQEAIKNLDRQQEIRADIICDYIENNKFYDSDLDTTYCGQIDHISEEISEDLIDFETVALHNACKSYETQIKDIYYKYATICNTEPINFTPVLIRLFLWQFYTDCNMHEKGLTLVEIDDILYKNPEWLARTPHGPFEKIYFWQFMHGIIAIASKLHAQRSLPGPKPHTILASALRYFIDNDVLPNVGTCKGRLTKSFGSYVPLKVLYQVYLSLGEPHTVRHFLCAIRRPPHVYMDMPQPDLVEASEDKIPLGRNIYIFGDEMTFVVDNKFSGEYEQFNEPKNLQLFNFGNLSSKTIIQIFSELFPQICDGDKIMNLDIKLTFYEFFEAFMACSEESIRVKEEELRWREMLAALSEPESVPVPVRSTAVQDKKIK